MSDTVTIKIGSLEAELKVLKSELCKEKKIERKGSFSQLRGIWSKEGDFSFQEIKEAELKI
ncbi:MAG: hypothetical protein CO162_06565 [bacterium (Candidatus Ratteibacteria) CG_4_9_14_3_um_filter_41_21]|uniref:Uncharacterized protein n=2 Tax=Candidatus Ratteibacteria TaxID=2979319 RepID=A0A2M7YEL1_9BACT|nr:MAG: hypothetical protein COS11_01675 [bacterium (Candidatus Ratteibacteria) CG01_land_8_20_14_3_00_40_19]PJA61389.1 MAG: hypothetical protein CO162_06565 [bacterium (Candidatus Ratteibacteria) CG_4_9_14_3_um_filter_41_21]